MSSGTREVRFRNRISRKYDDVTPVSFCTQNYLDRDQRYNRSDKAVQNSKKKHLTLINSFEIVDSTKKKCQEDQEDLSQEEEREEEEAPEECSETEENTSESEECPSDENESDIKKCIIKVDQTTDKIITGRDLINIFYSFSKWFNGLKDAFATATSTPKNSPENPISKPTSSRSTSCSSKTRLFYDNTHKVTGDLTKDRKLKLNYDPGEQAKPWNEQDVCKAKKYLSFIEKKCSFYDKLDIVPGIGPTYSQRLNEFIPNFGTLLELFITVDEMTFKALLKCYSRMRNTEINYVFTSCKKYFFKFGFKFSDVVVRPIDTRAPNYNLNQTKRINV